MNGVITISLNKEIYYHWSEVLFKSILLYSNVDFALVYDNEEWFNDTRNKINKVLSFEGFSLGENGKMEPIKKSTTISESKARASKLKESLLLSKEFAIGIVIEVL